MLTIPSIYFDLPDSIKILSIFFPLTPSTNLLVVIFNGQQSGANEIHIFGMANPFNINERFALYDIDAGETNPYFVNVNVALCNLFLD